MGTLCVMGNKKSYCRTVGGLYYEGAIPLEIRQFEARIIIEHFTEREPPGLLNSPLMGILLGRTAPRLDAWSTIPTFHSYYNASILCSGCSIERVWHEYLLWPLPMISSPFHQRIKHLDRNFVPYGAGSVTHYIYETHQTLAFINATNRYHVLYPGYIVRWLTKLKPVIISNTLGRGIGAYPGLNIDVGIDVFQELDRRIKTQLIAAKVYEDLLK